MAYFRIQDKVSNRLSPLPPGTWHLKGHIGEVIDLVAEARLTTEKAWKALYPQTEEAFVKREDDISHAPQGVWRGEFWGKYILGAIAAYHYYGNPALRERIRDAVSGLLVTQDPDGYIGTYTNSEVFGSGTWNIWCRKYTLWGLVEAWKLLGDDAILEGAVRFMDHLLSEVGPGRADIILTGQFNGLASTSILKPVVGMYRATGEYRYLEFAEYIIDRWSHHPEGPPNLVYRALSGKPIHEWYPEPEKWAKSYEFISCVEGLVELYRVTGETLYLDAAVSIHHRIAQWERTPVGGVSFNDKFIGARFLVNAVSEICDVVYWNRLSFQLFCLTGDLRYIDEIERVLYNALLTGPGKNGSWGLRRFRLSHLHIPAHRHFLQGHQCCVDNAPRGFFQAARSALFQGNGDIRITLYAPGAGKVGLPSGNELGLYISGDFLDGDPITIHLSPGQPESFTLSLRLPHWSNSTRFLVNGEGVLGRKTDNWYCIERVWHPGDRISVLFDVQPRVEIFDPTLFEDEHPVTKWHCDQWAAMVQFGDDNTRLPADQVDALTTGDCLPQKQAFMFFYGPQALARDIRLGDEDIFRFVPGMEILNQGVNLQSIAPPAGIRRAYTLTFTNGEELKLCDYPSAGNTWNRDSLFTTWLFPETAV